MIWSNWLSVEERNYEKQSWEKAHLESFQSQENGQIYVKYRINNAVRACTGFSHEFINGAYGVRLIAK